MDMRGHDGTFLQMDKMWPPLYPVRHYFICSPTIEGFFNIHRITGNVVAELADRNQVTPDVGNHCTNVPSKRPTGPSTY
jgi:hypothetical protein